MTANINPETGIPYGTIYLNNLDGDTADYLFYEGTNLSEKEAYEDARTETYVAIAEEIEAGTLDIAADDICDIEREAERRLERACEGFQIEEPNIEGTLDGVKYGISWLGGAPLLWVYESPHTGLYRGCSPCVPGAGDLDSPADPLKDKVGFICYDVPPDWRRKDAKP